MVAKGPKSSSIIDKMVENYDAIGTDLLKLVDNYKVKGIG